MTWLAFQGSSVQHAVDVRFQGAYETLCGLWFSYSPLAEPDALRRERCALCERRANPGPQPTLWESA